MFPHNSSSHEISTETNAFVQNSKGDVVVLMASSLSGVEEGRRPDSVRFCDIESTNNGNMTAPTSHPVATTTNDFLTVLPRQSGELGSAAEGKACQSVASAITKNPTNHLLIYDNNNKLNNHNNAEHNHHKYRKQNRPGSPGQLESSADNSKSISKLLSDNKNSFSDLSVRVLQVSLNLKVTRGEVRQCAGEPSLVRIPKSDCPPLLSRESSFVNNYSLLGSRLDEGENNNLKANLSFISNNNYSKSVILLSSTRNGDYYLLSESGGVREGTAFATYFLIEDEGSSFPNQWESVKLLALTYSPVTENIGICRKFTENYFQNAKIVILYSDCHLFCQDYDFQISQSDLDISEYRLNKPIAIGRLFQLHFDNISTMELSLAQAQNFTTCSSITLIVSTNESTSLRSFIENLTKVQPSLRHATVNELMQRICVPLMIECKVYVNNVSNNIKINNNNNIIGEEMNINNNNPDVIEDIVNVAVCYKTSCTMTTNYRLGFQNDGISYTQATMFTVGALSFQDNNKSNKPLHASFKDDKYQVSTKIDDKFNYNVKSVSKFTLSVRFSDKSETSHATRLNKSDDKMHVLSAVNIPTLTTCEPTMTLKRQPATVASQTNTVPASQVEKHSDVDEIVLLKSSYLKYDHKSAKSNKITSNHDQNPECFVSLKEEYYENDVDFSNASKNEDIFTENISEPVEHHQKTLEHDPCRDAVNTDDAADDCDIDNCDIDNKLLEIDNLTSQVDKTTKLFAYVRELLSSYQKAYKSDVVRTEILRKQLKQALKNMFNRPYSCNESYRASLEYKKRWGIPVILGLAGGGESSLNTGGAANWGTAPTAAPNNNNATQSSWGGTPGNPPVGTGPPSNWGGNNVNRPVTANPNQNQNQGPPSSQNNPGEGNVNKVTNPNQSQNPQSGPPTSQPNNATSGNQNNGQWPQGKSTNLGGPGQNQSSQNNNNPAQQPQQPGSNANNNPTNSATPATGNSASTPAGNNPSSKQQLEQLNTMREALFSQDGWGCQHVNQDTNWEVPSSPEPSMTKDGVPMWKPPVNNGTDLWEANLRNGGQPPPQQTAKTPWGHTPSTNIGGTWGEDDDAADSSNMWTGAPTPNQPNTAQWPGAATNQTSMSAGGGGGGGGGSSWGDPRMDPRDPRDLRSVDPREMRDPRDHRISLDPRDHMRVMDPMSRDPRMTDMRGDPRGISGRLNGASADAMWGQPPGPPHHQMGGHQHPSGPPAKMVNASSMNQWAAPPPKEMMPGKPSGWEEPSPPTQRRNVPNYDDGTSLWGNPAPNPRAMPGSKVSHWKDLPTPNLGRGGMPCPPGMPQNRMPGQPGMKPDVGGPMWGHPTGPGGGGGGGGGSTGGGGVGGAGTGGGGGGRNGSWGDGPHDTAGWDDQKTPAAWNEPPINPGSSWGGPSSHKPKPMGPTGGWGDADMDPTTSWAHPPKQTLTKELIWSSREFRYLCELGYKKEDVETALRSREMNRDEAHELLTQVRPLDQWRRHDTHAGYDPASQAAAAAGYPPRFNHVAQQMSFPPGAGMPSVGATGGMSGTVASASLLKLQQQQQQQAAVQLQQQQPSVTAPQPPFNQTSRTPQNQPSTAQLRMLVQQIQLAVQEGYLNHQILNQPLAPQTLILLNQLLQQIKVLQQLHQQHSVQGSLKGNSQNVLQISVQITKTKQQIANLQNQIAVQQATYMKQQQQQQHPAAPSQASDYYKSSVHDPMSALQNTFTDLTMNKEPPVSQQQSRLNQWKLPSLDKDGDLGTNEFSRAPGTTSKPPTTPVGLTQSHSSPNMNPLLGQGDGTWSSRLGDSGWPDAGTSDSTDGKDWQPGGAAFTDLVPEFEPGKPWKGNQMKSIEDDPSITPGSVVRSPLSLATIKDPDAIFSSSTKTSPPPSANADTSIPSLSNSTWSFNPPAATTPSAFASSKNTWGETAPPPTAVTSELWGAPMSKARGPPPGLGSKGGATSSNGWAGLPGVGRSSSSWGLQTGAVANAGWVSTWLLLKNLTPQIDGSTLKTLCMQHGPVQDFRLYLNHGIALAKYSSRDEAIKAQGALNNCVLGNTTIFAESPADSEVHTLLQQLGGQPQTAGSAGSGWGLRPTSKAGPPPDTWGGSSSQLWGAPPASNSLWSNAGIDSGDQQRATPSSLNSYLPGDLLGGESM